MALKLGWVPSESRESFWRGDPSVDWEAMDDDARDAYLKDGDRAHLKLKNGETPTPTTIRFRALTADERATILGLSVRPGEGEGENSASWARMILLAFRVGCELVDVESAKPVKEHGLPMLPRRTCDVLASNYGDSFWQFYGSLVWAASNLTEDEKKASQ